MTAQYYILFRSTLQTRVPKYLVGNVYNLRAYSAFNTFFNDLKCKRMK